MDQNRKDKAYSFMRGVFIVAGTAGASVASTTKGGTIVAAISFGASLIAAAAVVDSYETKKAYTKSLLVGATTALSIVFSAALYNNKDNIAPPSENSNKPVIKNDRQYNR